MKYINFMFMLMFTFGMTLHAGTLSRNNMAEFDLNRASPGAMVKHRLGSNVIKEQVRMMKGTFDFAKYGGLTGTYTLLQANGQPAVLPNKAVVVDCLLDVITAGATAASGTIAIGTGQATNDLKAALAAASYTATLIACVPVGTAATAIKMTADRTMTATIATGAITQLKVNVLVQYIISE